MLHHVKWNDFISISNSSEFLVLTRKVKNKKKIKKTSTMEYNVTN